MGEKQILAALEITSQEVRLLVGEFFNTRLNVIRTERVTTRGMEGIFVKSEKDLILAIRRAVDQASSAIGTRIERVLLCVPPYRMKKESGIIQKAIDNYDHRVTWDDLQTLVKKGYQQESSSDLALVNWMCAKYLVGGISTKRIPIDEICDMLEAEMDLFYASTITTYDYAQVVENCGLEIIDICLNSYAICKEAAIFEQAINQNIINVHVEADNTTVSVITDGRIEATRIVNRGYNEWVHSLITTFDISDSVARKLVLQNVDLSSPPSDYPVHMWNKGEEQLTISEKDLNEVLIPVITSWAAEIVTIFAAVVQAGNVKVLISGEGAEINGIDIGISQVFNCECVVYYPDTIGARGSLWTVCLGMVYAFVDQYPLYRNKKMSVNQASFLEAVKARERNEEPDDSFTQRLKGLLFQNQKK